MLGNQRIGEGDNHGVRFILGYWLDDCQNLGIEGNFFWLSEYNRTFGVSATPLAGSSEVLALPFVDETTGNADAQQIALPGQAGTIRIQQLHRLMGAEANLRWAGRRDHDFRLDFLAGFRFLAFDDNLDILTGFQDLTGRADPAAALSAASFAARNRFYGGQIGALAEWVRDNWCLQLVGKFALGGTDQAVRITGFTSIQDLAGATTLSNTSLYAQPTNASNYGRSMFAVVPEVGVNLAYQFNAHWGARVGYTFLYDSNVVRGGGQIDTVSNTPTLNGPLPAGQTRPAFLGFHGTDYWAQGITLGLEFRY